jgi:hypothetical protein
MSDPLFRICFFNYVDSDILANSEVSSEQTAFPVENAYNKNRRSKVWRSNGYFNVTSTNNKIIFRESAGVDLTATITVGEYMSQTTMCAAIKAALEVAGDSTYTVTNSSATAWKFTIVSNGSGGTGVFHLMRADVLFTAASMLGFGTSSSLTDSSLTRTSDYLTINSEEWIEWDMGLETNPKVFILIGPRNSPLKLTPSGTFKLQGNESNNWESPSFETTLEYNDKALFYEDEDGIGDQAYRYWRVLFSDQNANGYIEVGAFFLGNYFAPQRGRPQFPFEIQPVDRTQTIYSEGGQTYSDVGQPSAQYSIEFLALEKEDVEELEDQFVEYQTGRPFFVVMDNDGVFSSSPQRRIIFGKFAEPPRISLLRPNIFSAQLAFREEL